MRQHVGAHTAVTYTEAAGTVPMQVHHAGQWLHGTRIVTARHTVVSVGACEVQSRAPTYGAGRQ